MLTKKHLKLNLISFAAVMIFATAGACTPSPQIEAARKNTNKDVGSQFKTEVQKDTGIGNEATTPSTELSGASQSTTNNTTEQSALPAVDSVLTELVVPQAGAPEIKLAVTDSEIVQTAPSTAETTSGATQTTLSVSEVPEQPDTAPASCGTAQDSADLAPNTTYQATTCKNGSPNASSNVTTLAAVPSIDAAEVDESCALKITVDLNGNSPLKTEIAIQIVTAEGVSWVNADSQAPQTQVEPMWSVDSKSKSKQGLRKSKRDKKLSRSFKAKICAKDSDILVRAMTRNASGYRTKYSVAVLAAGSASNTSEPALKIKVINKLIAIAETSAEAPRPAAKSVAADSSPKEKLKRLKAELRALTDLALESRKKHKASVLALNEDAAKTKKEKDDASDAAKTKANETSKAQKETKKSESGNK